MAPVKKTDEVAAAASVFFTLASSVAFALTGRWLLLGLYLISLPVLLRCTRLFPGRENVGMFLALSVTGIPANAGMILRAVRSELFRALSENELLLELLWGIVTAAVLFSIEQVVMAVVTRVFWPRQIFDRRSR